MQIFSTDTLNRVSVGLVLDVNDSSVASSVRCQLSTVDCRLSLLASHDVADDRADDPGDHRVAGDASGGAVPPHEISQRSAGHAPYYRAEDASSHGTSIAQKKEETRNVEQETEKSEKRLKKSIRRKLIFLGSPA